MAALGVIVAVYVAVNWTSMPGLQRMVSLFFVSGGSTSGRACLLLAPLQRDRIECSGIPIALQSRNSVAGGLFLRQTGVWRLVCLIHPSVLTDLSVGTAAEAAPITPLPPALCWQPSLRFFFSSARASLIRLKTAPTLARSKRVSRHRRRARQRRHS
jgi:hypothetical protein